MRWMRWHALACFVVLVSGCVTNFGPSLKKDAAPNSANGVIAGEFSRAAPSGVAFVIRNTKTNVEYALSLGENSLMNKAVYAQVSAIEVPAGEYVIPQWETFDSLTKKVYTRSNQTITRLNTPFTVQAGQVIFLGGFNVAGAERDSSTVRSLAWRVVPASVSFDDARQAFLSAYPAYPKDVPFNCLRCDETLMGYTTHVKDVTKDPEAYLSKQFALSAIAPEVLNMIRASDSQPTHFSHIVMHLAWHYSTDAPGAASAEEVRTLIHSGGPFVEVMSEFSRGGVPQRQSYAMTYRNFLDLKGQTLDLSKEFAPPPREIEIIERFDSISSFGAGAQFSFNRGYASQGLKATAASASCKSEGGQAASLLQPSLEGDAINVVCKFYNDKAALTGVDRFVYLPQYGVSVPMGSQSSRGRSDAKLTAITIE